MNVPDNLGVNFGVGFGQFGIFTGTATDPLYPPVQIGSANPSVAVIANSLDQQQHILTLVPQASAIMSFQAKIISSGIDSRGFSVITIQTFDIADAIYAAQQPIKFQIQEFDNPSSAVFQLYVVHYIPSSNEDRLEQVLKALHDWLDHADNTADYVGFLNTLAAATAQSHLTGQELYDFLKSEKFEALGGIAKMLSFGATLAEAGADAHRGDVAGVFADFATFGLKALAGVELELVEVVGAQIFVGNPIAGAGIIGLGLAGQGLMLVFNQQIDDYLHKGFRAVFNTAAAVVHQSPPDQFAADASTGEAAQATARYQFATDPGFVPVYFDPGYYVTAHADAAQAVASGAYPSAYAYYLAVGVPRGDRPSPNAAPVAASALPGLPELLGVLNAFAPDYSGIFDLAIGSIPTDGVSAAEHRVGQDAFGVRGAAEDAALSGLANRIAIDLARNQHFSGASRVDFDKLSNGASSFDLENAAAGNFRVLTYYIVPAPPPQTVDDTDGVFRVIVGGDPVGNAYGIAEFGGVWIAVTANTKPGAQVHAAPSEPGGSAVIDFYGTNSDDTLYLGTHSGRALGGPGNDNLIGSSGNDTLVGGRGSDVIDGGLGVDKAVFSGLRSAYTVVHAGNLLKVSGPDGPDLLTNVEMLAFDDVTVPGSAPSNNFNGDGMSDLLWRHAGGQVAEWQMNGAQIANNLGVAAPGNEWHFQDTGDFGGDGRSDVMWRHDSGQVVLWQMNGNQIVSNTSILNVSNQYHVQGVGDFGGDGRSDVLFRHDSGQVVLWQMDGDRIASNTALPNIAKQYHIEGVGDFDGDGRTDVLWRHESGQVVLWRMNGDQIVSNTVIANVSSQYHVQGIGDLNGDGHSDVVWRHDSGQIVLWQMNGSQIVSNTQILDVSNQYHVQDVRDFNGDGMSDILLRHDSGQVVMWTMNGDRIVSNVAVATVGNDWTIQSHHFDLV